MRYPGMADPRRFLPYNRSLTDRARFLRRRATPAEKKLWMFFLRDQTEKFTRQKPLGKYVVDFYCAAARLAVEIDGDSHFTTQAALHDAARTVALQALGIRVMRFTNLEVMEQFEEVCQRIAASLHSAS